MLKPTYIVKIGSESFEASKQDPMVSIRINQDINIPADSFEIVFGVSDKTSKIKEGEEVSIQIGYDEKLEELFKGTVDGVKPSISTIAIRGLNYATKLLEYRVNQVYLNTNAGQIVKDLANKVSIKSDVSDGVKFPVYYVDNNLNAYEHIRELARKSGFDTYLTPESILVFKKYTKDKVHLLEYGINLIHLEIQKDRPYLKSVLVQGESASSFKGADSWPWLTKKEVSGTRKGDISSGTEVLVQDASIKETGLASDVALALMDNMSRTLSGTAKIVGDPSIRLGETIEIKGMSNPKMNGEFQIRSIEHYISKTNGYTTLIGWRK